jgi:beta-glucosidase
LHVSFELTNEGIHPVKEVAQLYIRDVAASLTRPVRELKAICHVELKPGESQRITLTLAASDLAFRDPSGRLKLEPGEFQIWIGGDSLAPLGSTFHLE